MQIEKQLQLFAKYCDLFTLSDNFDYKAFSNLFLYNSIRLNYFYKLIEILENRHYGFFSFVLKEPVEIDAFFINKKLIRLTLIFYDYLF